MDALPTAASRPPFDVRTALREIGRGKKGARGLSPQAARELMGAILDGEVADLALGAILVALRMKGEETDEILGFLEAVDERIARAPARAPGWVVIPSYNGARSTPNLVPLLALLLARAGLPALIHGQPSEPDDVARRRVDSLEILQRLGMPACGSVGEAAERVDHGQPAYLPLSAFSPGLSRLIALRTMLGVRNVAHSLAKLVRPVQGESLLLASYTHPAFGSIQSELFRRTGALGMNLRATDGEAVVSARRAQAIELWKGGVCRDVAPAQSIAPADADLPEMDAEQTARWTREVLDGHVEVPAALAGQVAAIAEALRR